MLSSLWPWRPRDIEESRGLHADGADHRRSRAASVDALERRGRPLTVELSRTSRYVAEPRPTSPDHVRLESFGRRRHGNVSTSVAASLNVWRGRRGHGRGPTLRPSRSTPTPAVRPPKIDSVDSVSSRRPLLSRRYASRSPRASRGASYPPVTGDSRAQNGRRRPRRARRRTPPRTATATALASEGARKQRREGRVTAFGDRENYFVRQAATTLGARLPMCLWTTPRGCQTWPRRSSVRPDSRATQERRHLHPRFHVLLPRRLRARSCAPHYLDFSAASRTGGLGPWAGEIEKCD